MQDTLQLAPEIAHASYGYDTVELDDTTSIDSQVVGIINTTDWWIGSLGLGILHSDFTGPDKPSFLGSLAQNQSHIPSHSYGYTAGAFNRLFPRHFPSWWRKFC
jgi:hypothetical protein